MLHEYPETFLLSGKDSAGFLTPSSPEQNTFPLLIELQGQIEAGRGKLGSWQFAANQHVSEGVTSKVWPLSTIKQI